MLLFKLLGLITALLTSLIIYSTSQVCDYNASLDLKKKNLDELNKEIGNSLGGDEIGDMSITYVKELDCIKVKESHVDEKKILNQIKEITQIVVAVINKDKLVNSSVGKNTELLSTDGKSDEDILLMLKNASKNLIKKKNELLGEPNENQAEEMDKLMEEYEKLLNENKSKTN